MKKLVLFVAIWAVMPVSFLEAREIPTTKEGVGILSIEAAECAGFYAVFHICLSRSSNEDSKEEITALETSVEIMGELATITSDVELASARIELYGKSIMKECNYDCGRIAIVVNKYERKCSEIIEMINNLP